MYKLPCISSTSKQAQWKSWHECSEASRKIAGISLYLRDHSRIIVASFKLALPSLLLFVYQKGTLDSDWLKRGVQRALFVPSWPMVSDSYSAILTNHIRRIAKVEASYRETTIPNAQPGRSSCFTLSSSEASLHSLWTPCNSSLFHLAPGWCSKRVSMGDIFFKTKQSHSTTALWGKKKKRKRKQEGNKNIGRICSLKAESLVECK